MSIQELLDKEARLSNSGYKDSHLRKVILEEIKQLRGSEAPVCWGEDDCSTMMLVRCPWRIDCDNTMD